jgi:single-strand DNA-binding protein
MYYHKLLLAGHIGKEPEIRVTAKGKMMTTSLAYTEKWKDKDGQPRENTDWFNLVAFGAVAEIVEKYIKKGDNVFIEGKIKNNTYENKSGQKVYSTQILVESIKKIPSVKGGVVENVGKYKDNPPVREEPNKGAVVDDEDVPF